MGDGSNPKAPSAWRDVSFMGVHGEDGKRPGTVAPARIPSRVIIGYGPRAAWQSAHISTVNSPSSLEKGPALEPQKEQCVTAGP